MRGARSIQELIAWQLADELKVRIYQLIARGPIARDRELCDQFRRAASSARALIAEGFGRYLPRDFSRYLRSANGELNEILDCLKDGIDRGYLNEEEVAPLRRLAKRASKAATRLIAYLRTSSAPHEPRGRASRSMTHNEAQSRSMQAPAHEQSENPENPPNPADPQNPENP